MKKELIVIVALVFASFASNAQVRQSDIIAAGGGYAVSGGISLSSTVGEPVGGTLKTDDGGISMILGFQQKIDLANSDTTNLHVFGVEDPANSVYVYPNPVSDLVNVQMSNLNSQDVTIQILNNVGALVFCETFEVAPTVGIDVADLPKGIYILKIVAEGSIIKTQKIIKL